MQGINVLELHKILEIKFPASKVEIRKAFLRLAKIHHPDKGGDEKKFKEINSAHEILMKDNYWHILHEQRHTDADSEYEYTHGDSNKKKKQHKGYNNPKTAKTTNIFSNDEGTQFWTEDQYGFVINFWGKLDDFPEEVYK